MTPLTARNDVCRTYFRSLGAPAETREIFALDSTGAVMICEPSPSDKRYGLLTTVQHGPLGTCQYRNRSVFKYGTQWRFDPPSTESNVWSYQFMALPSASCPPQENPSYVSVSGLSEDNFLRVIHAWQRAANSSAAMDRALRGLKSSDSSNTTYVSLKSSFFGDGSKGPQMPFSIRQSDTSPFAAGISPTYTLSFPQGSSSFEVVGNLEQDEFVIYFVGIGVY